MSMQNLKVNLFSETLQLAFTEYLSRVLLSNGPLPSHSSRKIIFFQFR
jgi:hypothetical protein